MGLFDLFTGGSPYMAQDRKLTNPRPDLLTALRYQIVPGLHGLPAAQIDLTFRRDLPCVSNPDMTLAVLLDRSGSMFDAFQDGHVYNVAAAIFNHVAAAGVGYNLAFYDDQVSYGGHMNNLDGIRTALAANGPRGGTRVTSALQGAVKNYRTKRGLYLIVITDGEFSDKTQAQQFIINELLPKVTPDNPYAFRIHFVGAGEGVDHGFLRQIEADASGQGVRLISQHHHAHLSHSHASILDELDRAFLGVGTNARFGDPNPDEPIIVHTNEPTTRRVWEGAIGTPGFLPRRVLLASEYPPTQGSALPIRIQWDTPQAVPQEMAVLVPLPRQSAPAPTVQTPSRKPGFHLPWDHPSPEEEAARADAAHQKALLAARIAQTRQAEQQRQTRDLVALAQGGLPVQATERLKEIGKNENDSVLFTSNLSPEEAALLRREGFQVRGLVTGSAMYHVGQAYASTQGDCEVSVLSDAYNTATDLAVSRMRQELQLIGAHGVVGVRLSLVRHEWADKTIEVQVMGTAIEGPGRPPADPWMCDLSGQEWWALYRAGYEPASLVWGHCTWFILTTYSDEATELSWNNQELTHWSHALAHARNRAMTHLTNQARQHHATGVAGVRLERRLDEIRLTGPGSDPAYEREHHNLVISIIGTAIRVRANAPKGVAPTRLVLSLRDGKLSDMALGAADAKIE